MIEDLIAEAVDGARLSESQVLAALAGSLGLIEKHGEPGKVRALFDGVQGTADLAEAGAATASNSGGGLLGGMMKAAGGAGGAAISDALALQKRLNRLGVANEDLRRLLPLARGFIERRTGRDLLGDALKSIPGVGGLLGG